MTNTKTSSIGWDAAYLTGSKLLVALIGVVTSMLLARFRTLDEYGTYSQLILVTDLVSSLLLLGVPNSISFFLAKANSNEEKQNFLSVYLTLSTLLTAIIGVCLFLAMPLIIEYFDNPMIQTFAYIFAVYPWASIMINSIGNTCIVYGKATKLIYFNILNVLTTLCILIIAKYLNWSFQDYMVAYMISLFVFACIGVGWIRKMAGRLWASLDWQLVKDIMKFSLPMGLAAIVGTLNVELDKLVIAGFFSTDEYAIFANAAKEMPVTMVTVSLTAVLLPQMVRFFKRENISQAIEMWGHAVELSLGFMCFVVGVFFVFAPDIISLFYSEKYVTPDAVIVFRIYSSILLFRAIYWGIVLNATGYTKFIFYSSIMTLLLNLVGNVILYYLFGFVGPAIATLLVTAIMAFIQLQFTSKLINVSILRIFPWKNMLMLLAETVFFCLIFAIVKYYVIGDYIRATSIIISIGLGVIWAILYILINYKSIKRNWQSLNNYRFE